MAKTRLVADSANTNSISGTRLQDGTIPGNKISSSAPISASVLEYLGPTSVDRSVQDKLDDFVNLKDFGASGDGLSDDSLALKAMWDHCNSTGASWFIPAGEYLIDRNITFYVKTGGTCEGLLILKKSYKTTEIKIVRDDPPSVLDTSGWLALNRGDMAVNAVSAYGMTVLIESDEILTPRYNPPSNQPYYKIETIRCDDPSGAFSTPLVNTYSSFNDPLSPYTTTVYGAPRSRPITVKGLNLLVTEPNSEPRGSVRQKITVSRDAVVLEDFTLIDDDPSDPIPLAAVVSNAADVHFVRPYIRGLPYPGLGYGILCANSIGTVIRDGNIQDCRHAITGRNNCDLTVDGGIYSKDIDDHWGDRMIVRNLTIKSVGGASISYAGNDITVSNVKIVGVPYLGLSIRNDVCSLGGNVVLRDISIESTATGAYFNLFGYGSGSTAPYGPLGPTFPGFKVKTPDSVVIENISLKTNKNHQYLFYALPPSSGADPTVWESWKKITVSGTNNFYGKPTTLVFLGKDSTRSSGFSPEISVDCSNPADLGSNGYSVYITASDGATTDRASVTLNGVGNAQLRHSGYGVGSLFASGCKISNFIRDLSQPTAGAVHTFFGCEFTGSSFDASQENCLFSNSVFSSEYSTFPSTGCAWTGCVRTAPQGALPANIRDNVSLPFS